MSRRTCIYEDQQRLTNLMDQYVSRLNPNTRTTAMKNIDENKVWIENNHFALAVQLDQYFKAQDEIESQLRLPRFAIPSRYRLHIDARNIPIGQRPFSGVIEMDVSVKEATKYLIFHSKQQTIQDVKVFVKSSMVEIPFVDFHLYVPSDTMTIYFDNELVANTDIMIRVEYSGNLRTSSDGFGFYLTSYIMNGVTHFLGATNFESSVGSRYAFPHYDEPNFKAVFELKITHSNIHHAISNGEGTADNR